MSTSTLVLNFVAWFALTVVVSAVAVGVPRFLDRPPKAPDARRALPDAPSASQASRHTRAPQSDSDRRAA